jgi:putative YhbY family RNA-binding protein
VSLTPRERAHLKARAHSLEPVVHVGQSGASSALLAEIDRALRAHELIKVKLAAGDRAARESLSEQICAATDAAPVQQVVRILVIWRPRPDDETPGR